jgi:hypothetical protein
VYIIFLPPRARKLEEPGVSKSLIKWIFSSSLSVQTILHPSAEVIVFDTGADVLLGRRLSGMIFQY